jgi:hypothetical protein
MTNKQIERRWEDCTKVAHKETGCGTLDWIHLAQDGDKCRALVYTVMSVRFL